jgi:plasmid replication initiation protein
LNQISKIEKQAKKESSLKQNESIGKEPKKAGKSVPKESMEIKQKITKDLNNAKSKGKTPEVKGKPMGIKRKN